MGVGYMIKKPMHSGRSSASVVPTQSPDSCECRYTRSPSPDGNWPVVEFGPPGTLHYRMLFMDGFGKEMSPWHGIPLHLSSSCMNFVCKTPRGSWAEFEIAESEHCNPLRLKKKKGKPSHYSENVQWNVGILPQTWADPKKYNAEYGGIPYDGSPIEVLEIGSRNSRTGEVYSVKPLAAFAVIHSSCRLSWKVLAVAEADDLADKLGDVEDVRRVLPGMIEVVHEWLRCCHHSNPGEKNIVYMHDHNQLKRDNIHTILEESHQAWLQLIKEKPPSEPWNFLLPRPISASVYESLWRQYTQREIHAEIPLSDQHLGPSVQYERAWAGTSADTSHAEDGSSPTETLWTRCESSADSNTMLKSSKPWSRSGRFRFSNWLHGMSSSHKSSSSPRNFESIKKYHVEVPEFSRAGARGFAEKKAAAMAAVGAAKPFHSMTSPVLSQYNKSQHAFEFERCDSDLTQSSFMAARSRMMAARMSGADSYVAPNKGDLSPVFSPYDSKSSFANQQQQHQVWKRPVSKPVAPKVTTTKSLIERLQLQSESPNGITLYQSSLVMHSGLAVGIPIDRYDDPGYFGLSRRNSL